MALQRINKTCERKNLINLINQQLFNRLLKTDLHNLLPYNPDKQYHQVEIQIFLPYLGKS